MGSFDLAIDIIKNDLKKLHAEKPKCNHNIERAKIVLDSLNLGKKLEE